MVIIYRPGSGFFYPLAIPFSPSPRLYMTSYSSLRDYNTGHRWIHLSNQKGIKKRKVPGQLARCSNARRYSVSLASVSWFPPVFSFFFFWCFGCWDCTPMVKGAIIISRPENINNCEMRKVALPSYSRNIRRRNNTDRSGSTGDGLFI